MALFTKNIWFICIVSAIIAVIGLAIALGVQSSQSQSQSQDSGSDTCTTQGCVQLAAQISSAMNQSVDPCQNFYQFSCGNWGQRNLIPPGELMLYCHAVTLAPAWCMGSLMPCMQTHPTYYYDIDKVHGRLHGNRITH